MKRIIAILLSTVALTVQAQLVMNEKKGDFHLLDASVTVSDNDYEVVRKVASMFIDDVKAVTGTQLQMGSTASRTCVIAGTIGHSQFIDQMISKGKLNVNDIQGDWERYSISIVKAPLPGIQKALVIAGSDRRGTAYGLLHISEVIGQNPWCWWADVPAKQHKDVFLSGTFTSKRPTVKYRGLFINDEDWGLTPWAGKTFEPEVGNIGPRTYAKVCQLLLRLKANYLCPAMHPCSKSFYSIPENKLVADSFAIVMGTSHCEPLFLNTASDWKRSTMGEWDYDKNRDGILNVLDQRVKETIPYENVYTLALRGLHDAHMNGGTTMKEKVNMLQSALQDQRQLIDNNTDTPIDQVPQAFTPYKEVLDIYSAGLELPEDVTIIWPDDNFGYMKRLSNPQEQQRSGRSGVYYHLSYLGVPHSYLWFGTTAPALMYEELRKAYDMTADRIWLANSGDIKGTEASLALFLAMAYDIEQFSCLNVTDFHGTWMAQMFGEQFEDDLMDIQQTQSRLCFQRKPEYMGWGYWNNCWGGGGEKRTDTEFSLSSYNEFERRLAEYQRISEKAEAIYNALPEQMKPAAFQLLLYPIKCSYLMNRMTMGGQLYRRYVLEQRGAAPALKQQVEADHAELEALTKHYNELLGGKWRHVMSLEQNYGGMAAYFKIPRMETDYKPVQQSKHQIRVEGEELIQQASAIRQLPVFSIFQPNETHWIECYNMAAQPANCKISAAEPWIKIEPCADNASASQLCLPGKEAAKYQQRIQVSIDWKNVPADAQKACINVEHDGTVELVYITLFHPANNHKIGSDVYVEHDGYVSIPAAKFNRKFENDNFHIFTIPGIGMEGEALQLGYPTEPLQPYRNNKPNSRVEYDFYTFNAGLVDVYTYVLPTFPIHSDRDYRMAEHTNVDTKYSVRIDDSNLSSPTTSATEYTHAWYDAILKNCRVNKSTLYVLNPGKHVLQIHAGDPSTVIQKIVIDFGGQHRSYAGPPSTINGQHIFE